MQSEKVIIKLGGKDLQDVQRIVLDRNNQMALEFVEKIIKPQVDAALDKGHCKPVFEWRRGQPEKIQPPPIKE